MADTPSALSEREVALINRRGVMPIAIVAEVDELLAGKYAPWRLIYDHAELRHREHRHDARQRWVARGIRVDHPRDMVSGGSVPFEEREPWEERARRRRAHVEEIAERIIRDGGGEGVNLREDFTLEREVLDELWRRWREVTADGFLLRALEDHRG